MQAGKPEPYLDRSVTDYANAFSPDGRWLAYESNESGRFEVYVQAFPASRSEHGGKWQISNGGGSDIHWPRTGRSLFYRSADQILSVGYRWEGDTLLTEKPREWLARPAGGSDWDLTSDGSGILALAPMESPEGRNQGHEVVFLLNFLDELRRRVPVRNNQLYSFNSQPFWNAGLTNLFASALFVKR